MVEHGFHIVVDEQLFHLNTLAGLVEVRITKEEKHMRKVMCASRSIQNWHDLVSEVCDLVMKSSQKERDEQSFSPQERKLWDESDLKEWKQWIKSGCVRSLPEWHQEQVPKTFIISAPVR